MIDRRLPRTNVRRKICVVCEGGEEKSYIDRLSSLGVWCDKYAVSARNAGSLDKISALYQNIYQNDNYDAVFIFCDTELAPYEKFFALRRKIDMFHDRAAAERVIIYVNPCTLQLVLSHYDAVRLKTNSKSKIAAGHLKKLFGLDEYRATERERAILMRGITAENYALMKERLRFVPQTADGIPGTNFLNLLSFLESADDTWIDKLNAKL